MADHVHSWGQSTKHKACQVAKWLVREFPNANVTCNLDPLDPPPPPLDVTW